MTHRLSKNKIFIFPRQPFYGYVYPTCGWFGLSYSFAIWKEHRKRAQERPDAVRYCVIYSIVSTILSTQGTSTLDKFQSIKKVTPTLVPNLNQRTREAFFFSKMTEVYIFVPFDDQNMSKHKIQRTGSSGFSSNRQHLTHTEESRAIRKASSSFSYSIGKRQKSFSIDYYVLPVN